MKKKPILLSLLVFGILAAVLTVGVVFAKYFTEVKSEAKLNININKHNTYTYAVLVNDDTTNTKTKLSIRSRKAAIVTDENGNPIQLVDKDGTYNMTDIYALPSSPYEKDENITAIAILENATVPTGARTDGWDADRNTDNAFELKITSISFDDDVKLQGNLRALFYHFTSLQTVDFRKADFSEVTNLYECFDGCGVLTTVLFDENINTSKVENMAKMFTGCSKLQTADISNFDFDSVITMSEMFNSCGALFDDFSFVNGLNAPKLTNISNMFADCKSMTSINFNGINTPELTSVSGIFIRCTSLTSVTFGDVTTPKLTSTSMMFFSCTALPSIDLSKFDTENVTNMSSTFHGCSNLTSLTLGGDFKTSSATTMRRMFCNCGKLTELDISYFDTTNVTDMNEMFNSCGQLTELDVSRFNTSNVTDMGSMFDWCGSLRSLNLLSFDTSNVTNMFCMFRQCSNLTELDLSSFDTGNVTNMGRMFWNNGNLTTIYASTSFVTDSVTSSDVMFSGCGKLKGGEGTTVSVDDATYARIDGGETNPGYFTQHIVNDWTPDENGIMHYGKCVATHNGTDVCGATVYEMHTFENDKCTKCDQHEHKVSDWTYVTGYTHKGTCTVENCGISVTEHHTFDENGICTLCSRKCTHSNPGWNTNDAEAHRKVCDYCKLTIQSGSHSFNSEGKCTVCSYQCKHTELSECTPNEDGTTHSGTCTTCKIVVSREHTYTDNKCVCGSIMYNLLFEANDGTNAPANVVGNTATLQIPADTIPTRDGYVFLGYDTNENVNVADVTYKWVGDGFSQDFVFSGTDTTATLYAIWSNTTITFGFEDYSSELPNLTAVEGMTWGAWIKTNYNTDSKIQWGDIPGMNDVFYYFSVDKEYLYIADLTESNPVRKSDVIKEGINYTSVVTDET